MCQVSIVSGLVVICGPVNLYVCMPFEFAFELKLIVFMNNIERKESENSEY